MNKIFKVIWSKARNCYVVVSELAKSHDDGHVRRSRSGCCRKAAVLAAFVLTTSLLAIPDWAQAATATNSRNPSAGHAVNIETNESTKDATDNSGTLAQGSGAYATYDSQGNLIMGKDNEVVPIQKDPKTGNARVDSKPENVVMGTRNGVGKFTHSTETKKPVSGDDSYAYQKLDTEWITVKVYNPNTNTYDDKRVEVYKLTPGQYMDDEYNVRAKYPERSYYSSDADYNKAVEVYNNVATYYSQDQTRQSYYTSGATAVGVDNVAEGDRSTAIGNKAKVLNSVSSYYVDRYGKLTSDKDSAGYWLDENGNITSSRQGYYASDGTFVDRYYMVPRLIDSTDAVALGSDVTAEGRSAVAIGHQSYAKEYSVAIGENSVTDYMGVAIGKDNKAKYASTAIGHTNDANGYYTATMGVNNTAHGDYSSAIGYQNTIDALQASGSERKAYESHAFGSENTIKGDYNLAAGDKNSIDKISGMAVGVGNKISMDHNPGNSNPINLDNQSGDYSIAVGLGNKSEKNALVIGKYSSALHDGSIAIGNSVNSNENNNNGANDSIAIGTGSKAMTQDSIAFGHGATIGNNNTQGINGAIAIGKGADAENGQSLAIGYEAYTGNNKDVATNKDGSIIAIGTNAQAMAGYDIAIGAKASTASSKTSNSGGSAVAIGYNAVINDGAQRSVAMGANASVALNVQDAVALGSQSYADRAANNQGGYDPASNSKNHNAGSDPVWNSTLAAVSVGSSDHYVWDGTKNIHYAQQTRQITNVAAGKEDTDAVNVAQLKQVVNLVNNSGGGGTSGSGVHDYSVKSVNPGTDTNYNNGGASGDNALAAGVSASATGAHSVAVGNGATAKGQDSIALGTGAVADGIGATAIGQYNTASGQNSLAFGGGYNKDQKGNTASGVASVAFGEGTQALGEGTLAFGMNTQAGSKNTDGSTSGQDAVAFGRGTKALGGRSLAFGEDTVADFNDSIAFGAGTKALSTGSTAFGSRTRALAQYSTALGNSTVAAGTYSVAFGTDTVAGAVLDEHGAFQLTNGTKMDQHGNTAYTDSQGNTYSVTYTVPGGEKHSYVVLEGQDGKTYIRDYRGNIRTAMIGNDGSVTVGDIVKGATEDKTLIKAQPGSNGYDLISNSNATAWGESSSASGEASTAFGIGSKAEGKNSLAALGGLAANDNSIAIGEGTKANNADKAVSVAIGQNAEASGERSLAIGFGVSEKVNDKDDTTLTSTKASGESAIAIGTDVVAKGQHSVAMGSHTDAAKDSSVAIGFDTHTVSDSAVAIGSGTRAEGRYSVALGLSSVAGKETNDVKNPLDGGGSVAIGYSTSAEASRSVAIGTGATAADAEFTTALGDSANAQQRGSVAIGAGSVATRAAGNKEGGTEYKAAYLIPDVSKATEAEKATWTSTEGAVSVGGTAKYQDYDENGNKVTKTKLLTRQITNVAAGSLDTDAVNVAQLKKMAAEGLDFQGNNKDVTVHRDLGQKLTIQGEGTKADTNYSGENLKVIGNTDGSLTIKMDKDIKGNSVTVGEKGEPGTPGKDGVDGTIGVNGKDGSAVVINGRDGSIGLNGKDGANGLTIKGADGAVGVDGTDGHDGKDGMTRIVYEDDNKITHEVATLDDGLKFKGDDAKVITKKLNEQLDIVGGAQGDLTDKNIAVKSTDDGKLKVQMAKKLTDLTSVTTGNTTLNNSGLTITNSDVNKNIAITDGNVTLGGNQVKNMGSGSDGTADGKPTYNTLTNGANIGDVKNIVQNTETDLKTKGLDFQGNNKDVTVHRDLGQKLTIQGEGTKADTNYSGENLKVIGNTDGSLTIKMDKDIKGNSVTVGEKGEPGTPGKDGVDGTIGVNGKDGSAVVINGRDGSIGLNGKDGANGLTIKGDKGKPGVDGTDGHDGKDGMTRIVYEDNNKTTHEVATLDDGLKFKGDDAKVITKKLNEQLDIVGGAQGDLTDKNIAVKSTDDGKLKVQMAKKLTDLTSVTTGNTTLNNSGLTITNSDTNKNIVIEDGNVTLGGNQVKNMGSGSDGTVDGKPTYNTLTNGANIGDVKNIVQHTETDLKTKGLDFQGNNDVTVHRDLGQKLTIQGEGTKADTDYSGENLKVIGNTDGSLTIKMDKDIKGNSVTVGEKGEPGTPGKDGVDGTIGVNGKDGSAVVINGRDGSIGLNGKDGANGLTIKGADGAVGVDGTDGHDGKDGMTRIVYEDDNKITHEVATLDDGLKFVGNDGQKVIRKLNSTLSIKGGITDKAALQNASTKNLGVRSNKDGDGLEIVMTDTPDFTKVTVGGDKKITIGGQTNSDTKNPASGNYITGLDNTKWDKDHVTENRAATEGQLRDVAGSITNQSQGGGFGLADEAGNTVKKDLGQTVTVKGDDKNIETTVKDGALEVSLKKDVDLGKDGSIKAGETTINSDGVETNKVKVGDITITDQGINGGAKQITNIASGIDGKQYATEGDNNAASIGDVKKIAGDEASKAADAVKSKSGKNITVKDDHTVNLNDSITLGDETDASKQVSIDGNGAKVTAGDGANKVTMDGSKGQVVIGTGDSTMTLGKQENKAGDSNPKEGNFLNGLDNRKWDGEHIQSGRAATEDQLKTVSDKVNSGRKFQGDDGQNVTVGMGDTLKIQGGVKAEDVSQENNIGIVKGADDTLNIRLAKDLKGINSIEAKTITTGDTTINNSGLTVKGDDNHKAITIQQGNVNMGGNTISGVADGKVSKDSTDAVNGSQLWQRDQAINGLSGSVNKLGNRINRVGAGAAALAALHPLDFDPDDKWDFAAGYGNYRGANAAAIGAYYRPNEDTMFSVGGSFGGGENMVNAGVSIKLGQGNHVSTSRVAMAKEMKAMRQHMAEQDALIAKLQSMHGMAVDPAKSTLFPDVAENHWAYQYVTTLAKKGILEGYPDGEFKGDRMMTRYEFAAIVYRIVESGVGSTDPELSKLVKEFSPELQYIRIDTIQKDRNGKPTIERVRVISDAK